MTYLDKYVLLNFAVQGLIMLETWAVVQHGCTQILDKDATWRDGKYTGNYSRVVPNRECHTDAEEFDAIFGYVFLIAWISIHVLFGVMVFMWLFWKRRQTKEN